MPGSLLSLELDRDTIPEVRRLVTKTAREAGLTGSALEGFVLAVHEAVTNAVRYGLPPRGIAIWREQDALVCEVTDSGPGIPSEILRRPEPEGWFGCGGRGLWLMDLLSDLHVSSGAGGTTIRLSTAVR